LKHRLKYVVQSEYSRLYYSNLYSGVRGPPAAGTTITSLHLTITRAKQQLCAAAVETVAKGHFGICHSPVAPPQLLVAARVEQQPTACESHGAWANGTHEQHRAAQRVPSTTIAEARAARAAAGEAMARTLQLSMMMMKR
jgi:hypothetical protein